MVKKIPVLILCFILFSASVIAQITEEQYHDEMKQLESKKVELNSEISTLKTEIDSLNKIIPELRQELADGYRELFELKYGEEIGWRIINKRIWKGMTDEMVKDGWGEPDRIDKNVEAWGVFTQWIYGDIIFFFRDGKLTDWQEGPEN